MDLGKKQNREFFTKKFLLQTIGIIFLIVIIILVIFDIKIYLKKKELISQVENYQKQIDSIKKNNQELKDKIANSDNIDYLEKIAYEQLGQQKPGEKEIIFIAPEKKPEITQNKENFWSRKNLSAWLFGAWQWLKSKF